MDHEVRYRMEVPTTDSVVRRFVRSASKRVLDLVVGGLVVVVLAPLLAVVAIAIKIDSRGPVMFHQYRVGARRRLRRGSTEWEATTFRVHKFRSMIHRVDEAAHRDYIKSFVEGTAEELETDGPKFKLDHDPRITRVGRVIRRWSIDELPQLFNVLAGEMSLVGPRPVPIYEAEHYELEQMERFHALPGMTGYWQVYGRGEVPFEEMIRMDQFYVRNQTMRLDLVLLARTLPAVLSGKGAG